MRFQIDTETRPKEVLKWKKAWNSEVFEVFEFGLILIGIIRPPLMNFELYFDEKITRLFTSLTVKLILLIERIFGCEIERIRQICIIDDFLSYIIELLFFDIFHSLYRKQCFFSVWTSPDLKRKIVVKRIKNFENNFFCCNEIEKWFYVLFLATWHESRLSKKKNVNNKIVAYHKTKTKKNDKLEVCHVVKCKADE